jgi:hypothetical protein
MRRVFAAARVITWTKVQTPKVPTLLSSKKGAEVLESKPPSVTTSDSTWGGDG